MPLRRPWTVDRWRGEKVRSWRDVMVFFLLVALALYALHMLKDWELPAVPNFSFDRIDCGGEIGEAL